MEPKRHIPSKGLLIAHPTRRIERENFAYGFSEKGGYSVTWVRRSGSKELDRKQYKAHGAAGARYNPRAIRAVDKYQIVGRLYVPELDRYFPVLRGEVYKRPKHFPGLEEARQVLKQWEKEEEKEEQRYQNASFIMWMSKNLVEKLSIRANHV